MRTSRAAILKGLNQPFEIEEVVWDDPRDDEVAVKVVVSGLCHSDWHCINGDYDVQFPILAGHEGVGIVEAVGKNVTKVQPGDHIVMSWMASCGVCPWCVKGQGQLCDRGEHLMDGARDDGSFRVHMKDGRDCWQLSFLGTFSDYIVTNEKCCIKVDPSLPLDKIPVVGCRIPTGWGAVVHTAQAHHGCTALVVGLGGVGMNVIQGLKSVNANVIIAADIHDKEKWAREFGATHYIDASKQDVVEEVYKITGIGVDYSFDCIGLGEVQAQCVKAIHKGGHAVFVGVAPITQTHVELNTWKMTLYQQRISGTCYGGRSPFELVPQMIEMYKAGQIKFDELITKEYTLDQINEGYADMFAGKNICGIIRY
ncbi:zinc-binding dehydrogenase [Candidatus Formimonas warabiya]|uniref:Enoyl reductase (ER) domain-containing protein n=1 Tax=Formimonas warabiya TaxID=1761012 RepID=A0A3G1KR47_FORW1|nr:Zn-dependent alcohol dehydrogenase [Candidatus Formimonas warabiya]ATW24931.1 hypothetical protein DCMF_09235 [Candidatus Formimonas warabiya]